MALQKPVHTIVLDTGAIIRNHPTVSTLLAQAEQLVTVPAIISEIKDAVTRSRVETTLRPFLTLRSPTPASIKVVSDFARKTGDLAVLSKPDIQIIALAYELECERNNGDWRLRRNPGQKELNGSPPPKEIPQEQQEAASGTSDKVDQEGQDASIEQQEAKPESTESGDADAETQVPAQNDAVLTEAAAQEEPIEQITESMANSNLGAEAGDEHTKVSAEVLNVTEVAEESESDGEGWITPSNLKKHQIKDAGAAVTAPSDQKTMQVGTLTTDYAMQNVILQMNLNLLSPSMDRVKQIKTFVLRCHACFQVVKQTDKQFCPRCGKPALTRVSCSTNTKGEFKLHLKKNMQWNTRGDRYSIPKAVHGSSNGRVQGGGKGHWGNELILAEDQKEYQRAVGQQKRIKEKDLMDEDYLPSILTGDRGRAGGRVKVGAGRNVNSKKR